MRSSRFPQRHDARAHFPAAQRRDRLEIQKRQVVPRLLFQFTEILVTDAVQPVFAADGGDLVHLVRVLRRDARKALGERPALLRAVQFRQQRRIRAKRLHVLRVPLQKLAAGGFRLLGLSAQKVGDRKVIERLRRLRRLRRDGSKLFCRLGIIPAAQSRQAFGDLGRVIRLLGRPYKAQARAGRRRLFLVRSVAVHVIVGVVHVLAHPFALLLAQTVIILFQGAVAEVVITVVQPFVRLRALVLFAFVQEAEPVVRGDLKQFQIVVYVRKGDELVRVFAVQFDLFMQIPQPAEVIARFKALIGKFYQVFFTQVEGYRLLLHSFPSRGRRACAAHPLP